MLTTLAIGAGAYVAVSYVAGGIFYAFNRNDDTGLLKLCVATSPVSMPLIAYLTVAHKLAKPQ